MIGVHLVSDFDGEEIVVWFPFSKTLEQGDQLVKRLEREAAIPYEDPASFCLGGRWHSVATLQEKEKAHESILAIPPYSS